MDMPDWIITVVCLAAAGGTFLRLVAIDREVILWRAEVEAEEASKVELDRQRRDAAAVAQMSDVELA